MTMKKEIKAFVITTKTSHRPRRFYGAGEWVFPTIVEAEEYREKAQMSALGKTQYIILPVTITFDL